jgi:hypothetical protein
MLKFVAKFIIWCLLRGAVGINDAFPEFPSGGTGDQLLSILRRYEIRTHIEIVLIGQSFDEVWTKQLSQALMPLAQVSFLGSPMTFVHEKIIYHCSRDPRLEKQLQMAISGYINEDAVNSSRAHSTRAAVDPAALEALLAQHRTGLTTATTLFVLNIPSKWPYQYKYIGTGETSKCVRSTFVSGRGFAWIDLQSIQSEILPRTDDGLSSPFPGFWTSIKDGKRSNSSLGLMELASFVHTSVEALTPMPRVDSSVGPKPLGKVILLLITICGDVNDNSCSADADSFTTLNRFRDLHSTGPTEVQTFSRELNLHSNSQLLHALRSAAVFAGEGSDSIWLNSERLFYWLGHMQEIRRAISSHLSPGASGGLVKVLPIFIIKLPTDVAAAIDETKSVVAGPLEPPAAETLLADEVAGDHPRPRQLASLWPKQALVALKAPSHKTADFLCDGQPVSLATSVYTSELWGALREGIWGVDIRGLRVSQASGSLVRDFVWTAPAALVHGAAELGGLSFPQKREAWRHYLLLEFEYILSQFSAVVASAMELVPRIDVPVLLGATEEDKAPPPPLSSTLHAQGERISSFSVRKGTSARAGDHVWPKTDVLRSFLATLDAAAIEFSHLDYQSALYLARKSRDILEKALKRAQGVSSARLGTITCEQATQSSTSFHTRVLEARVSAIEETYSVLLWPFSILAAFAGLAASFFKLRNSQSLNSR